MQSSLSIFHEEKPKIILTEEQDQVLQKILTFLIDPDERAMVVKGPAGTGKTTMLKQLLEDIPKQAKFMSMLTKDQEHKTKDPYHIEVKLTTPTHKAADVLSVAAGKPATTIHNLLKLALKRDYDTGEEYIQTTSSTPHLERTLVILDEAGMCDKELFEIVMDCTSNCKLLLVGDPYQLPPVNENHAQAFSQISNQAYLSTIMRQALDNPIIQFSQGFRETQKGMPFPEIRSYGTHIQHLDGIAFKEKVHAAFQSIKHPDENRILCWTNARVKEYNNYVRKFRGYPTAFMEEEWVISNKPLMYQKAVVARPDSVIQIRNIKPINIADIPGWEVRFYDIPGEYFLPANFQKLKQVENKFKRAAKNEKDPKERRVKWAKYYQLLDACCDLRPSYASTINKAQGSTYQNVFIDLNDIGRNWDKTHVARLLYTATTRAAQNLYLYGDLPRWLYG